MAQPQATMAHRLDTAYDELEAQLRAAARQVRYEYLVTFMDDPARYAHLQGKRVCGVAERVCFALTEERAP